jgi:hypothetical protein
LTEHRVLLETLRDPINPRWLRQHIYDAIDAIFALPGASPGVAEDVYKTLATHQNLDLGGDTCFDFAFNRTPLVEGDS